MNNKEKKNFLTIIDAYNNYIIVQRTIKSGKNPKKYYNELLKCYKEFSNTKTKEELIENYLKNLDKDNITNEITDEKFQFYKDKVRSLDYDCLLIKDIISLQIILEINKYTTKIAKNNLRLEELI